MPIAPKVRITGSSSLILQPGTLPIVRPGSWHTLPPYGAPDTVSIPADRLYALPFWPGSRCACIGTAVNVTTPVVGASLRIGLYSSANGLPVILLSEYGTLAAAGLGIQILAGFETPMEPALYFLGIVRQGGIPALGLSARDTWDPIISELAPVLTGSLNTYYRDGVGGVLPAMFGPVDGSIQGPSAAVQLT